MIHSYTELRFISKEKGYGVVATRFIPKGTITWAHDQLDRVFEPQQVRSMDKVYQDILYKYTYRDGDGNYVLCWDHARFVNHSFNSNCISTAYNFELAVRDIFPGEELTDDYGYLNCEEPFNCLPEANSTRTEVRPDDLLNYYNEWDNKLLNAFQQFNQVEQALLQFVEPVYKEKVKAIIAGHAKMDSILNLFFNDDRTLMQRKEELLNQSTHVQL